MFVCNFYIQGLSEDHYVVKNHPIYTHIVLPKTRSYQFFRDSHYTLVFTQVHTHQTGHFKLSLSQFTKLRVKAGVLNQIHCLPGLLVYYHKPSVDIIILKSAVNKSYTDQMENNQQEILCSTKISNCTCIVVRLVFHELQGYHYFTSQHKCTYSSKVYKNNSKVLWCHLCIFHSAG